MRRLVKLKGGAIDLEEVVAYTREAGDGDSVPYNFFLADGREVCIEVTLKEVKMLDDLMTYMSCIQ